MVALPLRLGPLQEVEMAVQRASYHRGNPGLDPLEVRAGSGEVAAMAGAVPGAFLEAAAFQAGGVQDDIGRGTGNEGREPVRVAHTPPQGLRKGRVSTA